MAKKSEKRKEQNENTVIKKVKTGKSVPSSKSPKQKEDKQNNCTKFDIELQNKIPALRVLNPKSNITSEGQTNDVSIPVDTLFSDGFPEGKIEYYVENDTRSRTTRDETRLLNLNLHEIETSMRKGAEVHKEVRSYLQSRIRPGMRYWDLCCDLEDKVRFLIGENGPQSGMGFPTGMSPNHIAAHYTPNPGDTTVLNYDDVVKVDFGTEVNGYIIDSAFTIAFNPQFDELLCASKDATMTGLRAAGVDARLGEIGGIIEEVINSYEVTIFNRTYPIVPIRNLSGHSMVKGSIHGEKLIPLVYEDTPDRMEEGDIFALETFATTGSGMANPQGMASHYALNKMPEVPMMTPAEEKLYCHLKRTFDTLPFCRRWLDREDGGSFAMNGTSGRQKHCIFPLKQLVRKEIVEEYPPLCDKEGSYSSQFEHCFLIKENCKEIFSMGNDY